MVIHEYQAKELFAINNIEVPKGYVAYTAAEAVEKAELLGSFPVVVKSQIHAGGRGKAGGVKLAFSTKEVEEHANGMLGNKLITKQTGPEGKTVNTLYIEQGVDIKKEIYLSILLDRSKEKAVIVASSEGGMDIEEVSEKNPDKIIKVDIDPLVGIQAFNIRELIFRLGIDYLPQKEFSKFITKLYNAFINLECMMVEINPLIITGDNKIMALDAKVDTDSNALIRHPKISAYRDESENHPLENIAFEHGINYINVDDNGNIGSMVNGAGLAMATMDSIKIAGGQPANFLDVGGGANAEMIAEGLKIITQNRNVKSVFINIFGGILRCDILAEGVIKAAKSINIEIPLVVRLKGTNAEEGRKMFNDSDLNIISVEGMKEGAEKVVFISNNS